MKNESQRHMLAMVFILVLSIAITETATSQMGFPEEGIRAARGRRPLHTNGASAALSSGGLVQTWTEGDLEGIIRVYVQVVTSDGELLFPENPLIISNSDIQALDSRVIATSDGDALICWKENVGEPNSWNIRAQRLNDRGEIQWDEGGKIIHQYREQRGVTYEFVPDFDGGGFLVTRLTYRPNSTWIYSLDENGDLRDGWNEDGFFTDSTKVSVYPINGGGCWIKHHDGLTNRLMSDGSLRWEESFIPELPQEGMNLISARSDGSNLFVLFLDWDWEDEYGYGVTVYDTTGESIASDIILEKQVEDNFEWVEGKFIVSEDSIAYLLFSEHFMEGDVGGMQYEMPWVICYDPFSDERLPWGENGIQLPQENDNTGYLFAGDAGIHRLGETLIITELDHDFTSFHSYHVYTFNQDGEPIWNEQPKIFPQIEDIHTSNGRNSYSNGEQIWVVNSADSRPGCFSFDGDGELTTGEHPVWLMPGYRSSPGFVSGHVMNSSDYNILGYFVDGLFSQSLDGNGELEHPLNGQLLDDIWPVINLRRESGKLGNRQWLWQYINDTTGQLAVLDEAQNFLFSRRIEFPDGDLDWRTKTIFDSDPDHLIILRYLGAGIHGLTKFDLSGEEVASNSFTTSRIFHLEYVNDYGWVVASSGAGVTKIALLNEDLQEIWDESVELNGVGNDEYPSFAIQTEEDYLNLIRLKYDDETDLYWSMTAGISSEGELLSEDSVQLFSVPYRGDMDQWSTYPVRNRTVWFLGTDHINYSLIQGIDSNGRRLLGDDGLRVRRNTRLLPDDEGGCWLLWDDLEFLRVLHLDENGQPWRGIYPPDGFALYNREEYSFYGADIDRQTGHVWVSMRRKYEVLGEDMPDELRVQVLGDEWVSAPIEGIVPHPSTFIIYPTYPNPFNSTTTISYGLPYQSDVSLRLYNTLGQRVSTLYQVEKSAGVHQAVLNSDNLPSGLYFVHLEASERTITKKVMLIR